ncbi:MAG: alpha/beta hydrolase [Nitrospirota bacterium]
MDQSFIFFPDQDMVATPAQEGLSFSEIALMTKDNVRIHGWWIPNAKAKRVFLLLHGNGGNISHRVEQIKRLYDQLQVSIFILDYREYGKSDGKVSEAGTYLDAEAAYDYLAKLTHQGNIIVYGHSLGAAVAVELAVRRKVGALILESPFLSILEMAKVQYGWLPLSGLITTLYDNQSKIKKLHLPLLILHGDADELVPYGHGQRLFYEANEPKQFYTVKHAGHNNLDLVGGAAYYKTIANFLEAPSGKQNWQ